MFARKRLDIDWIDLMAASCYLAFPGSPDPLKYWNSDSLVTLSVRSGFDLLLSALSLPTGSEVLVSAVNLRDMVRIIAAHGLVAVPVDLDMKRLEPKPELLEAAITPRSRALLVAHLYGSRLNLDYVVKMARERDLLLIEDCAQAYTGRSFQGHLGAVCSMFSFGTIKTATALGGGILTVRDPELLKRMRRLQATYARQSRAAFLRRLTRAAALKFIAEPLCYSGFVKVCQILKVDFDRLVNAAARGFTGDLMAGIRKRPSGALLRLLERRLKSYDERKLEARAEAGAMVSRLSRAVRPGSEATGHTYWLYPIYAERPEVLMEVLRGAGYDATRGASQLQALAGAEEAVAGMARVVYVPVYPEMGAQALARLADLLNAYSFSK